GGGGCDPPCDFARVWGGVPPWGWGGGGSGSTVDVAFPAATTAGLAPCAGAGEGLVVALDAPADGRFEVEARGDGTRIAGVFDRTGCASGTFATGYACAEAETLTVAVDAGDRVLVVVAGASPDGGATVRAALRHRFVAEVGLSAPCTLPGVDCRPGLSCAELGGTTRCLPAPTCGGTVPVAALTDVATEVDGGLQVVVPALPTTPLPLSCALPFAGRYVLRTTAVDAERWVVTGVPGNALGLSRDCASPAEEFACSAFGPLVVDLDAGQRVDVMSAALLTHDLRVVRRRLLFAGDECADPEAGVCRPGAFCSAAGVCSVDDSGCGPGVEVRAEGARGAGRHTLRAEVPFAPTSGLPVPALLCAQPAGTAAAVFSFEVSTPSTVAVTTTGDVAPAWALREGCAFGPSLSCGNALDASTSPLLRPGRTYYVLAYFGTPAEGNLEADLVLAPTRDVGDACDDATAPCHPSLTCSAGLCAAP
ncbi:MAG: hypothetical protein AAF447_19205, partial [Myxococcota bacterium]